MQNTGSRSAIFLSIALSMLLSACGQAATPDAGQRGVVPTIDEGVQSASPSDEDGAESEEDEPREVAPGVVIQPPKSLELSNYFEFTFQRATTVGLSPESAQIADRILEDMFDPVIEGAIAANETEECPPGEDKCGFFSLTLEWLPCSADLLCVRQVLGQAGIGMATGFSDVAAVRIDESTGLDVPIERYLASGTSSEFFESLNSAAESIQKANDFYFEDSPPNYSEESMPAWLPLDDGIHVWFPKYSVAPGAYGVVEIVVVEEQGGFRAQPAAPKPEDLVDSFDIAYEFICGVSTDDLPRLTDPFASSYAVSALQWLLGDIVDDAGNRIYEGLVTGLFDDETVRAVKVLQESTYVEVDGLVGPQTWNVVQYKTCWHEEFVEPSVEDEYVGPEVVEDLVAVPQVVGLRNKDAQSVLGQAGLGSSIQAQIGDPSIAAQSSNQCIVVSQNPPAGSPVKRGSMVTARMQCPNTGYNAPGAPQSWSG